MLPSKTSAHHFNSKIKFDIAVNCAWCVDWVFHSWSENTEEFSILGLNVPNSPYHYLLLLVKVMIHISSLSRSFYKILGIDYRLLFIREWVMRKQQKVLNIFCCYEQDISMESWKVTGNSGQHKSIVHAFTYSFPFKIGNLKSTLKW